MEGLPALFGGEPMVPGWVELVAGEEEHVGGGRVEVSREEEE